MKKIFVLIICLISLCSPLSIYAKNDSSDEQNIKQVVSEAIDLRDGIGGMFKWLECGNTWEEISNSDDYIFAKPEGFPCEYACYPVITGYDRNGIIEKINNTFSEEFAQKIIDNNDNFFSMYYEENEESYYVVYWGSVFGHYLDNDSSQRWGYYFTQEKINQMKISFVDEDTATAEVDACTYMGQNEPNENASVYFILKKDNLSWKISEIKVSDLVFRQQASETNLFSKEVALSAIKAVIYELYNYNIQENSGILDTAGIDDGEIVVEGDSFIKLEGNLSSKKTWEEYGKLFCSGDIINKILTFDRNLVVIDGEIYRKGSKWVTSYEKLTSKEIAMDIKDAELNNIEIVSSNQESATVTYVFGKNTEGYSISDHSILLTVEFEKVGSYWKITGGDFVEKLEAFSFEQEVYLTEAEANKLIMNAHDIEYSLLGLYQWMKEGKSYSLVTVYHTENPNISYAEVRDDISCDKGMSIIKNTFVSKVSSNILKGERYKVISDSFEDIDGKICLPFVFSNLLWDVYINEQDLSEEIELINLGNGKAVANVPTYMRENEAEYPEYWPGNNVKKGITKVYFEYEDGSWKVSGGDFFTFLNEYGLEKNPSTGDDTLVMGVVVCLTMLVTLILKLRRRLTIIFLH